MARANQGVRQDLNFSEIENEVVALGNLSEVGLANDLRIIQNNLRNTSRLAFNSVNVNTDEFLFNTDKTLSITSGTAESSGSSTEVTIEVSPAYNTYSGEVITVSGFTGTGSDIFNGTYSTLRGLKKPKLRRIRLTLNSPTILQCLLKQDHCLSSEALPRGVFYPKGRLGDCRNKIGCYKVLDTAPQVAQSGPSS